MIPELPKTYYIRNQPIHRSLAYQNAYIGTLPILFAINPEYVYSGVIYGLRHPKSNLAQRI